MITLSYDGRNYANWSVPDLLAKGVDPAAILSEMHRVLFEKIDTAAGNARAAFVSPGSYIDQEYQLAKQEASDWLANGKIEAEVPSSVQDHIAMFGVSAEVAAQKIVTTAEEWEQALAAIRSVRLGGKSSVRRADTIEAAEQAAQAAIAQLDAIRPPEGSL